MFEQFYGKQLKEITQADLSPAEEIDWDEEDATVERRKTKRWDRERIKKRTGFMPGRKRIQ